MEKITYVYMYREQKNYSDNIIIVIITYMETFCRGTIGKGWKIESDKQNL